MTQNINLITELSIKPISAFNSKLIIQISLGWILLLVLIYIIAFGIRANKQQHLTKLETSQKEFLAKLETYNQELPALLGGIPLENLPNGSGNLMGFYRYFKDLAIFTPHGVWLTLIAFSEINNTTTIQGSTVASSGVSALLEALSNSPNFRNKKFSTLQLEKKPDATNINFTISTISGEPTDKTETKKTIVDEIANNINANTNVTTDLHGHKLL